MFFLRLNQTRWLDKKLARICLFIYHGWITGKKSSIIFFITNLFGLILSFIMMFRSDLFLGLDETFDGTLWSGLNSFLAAIWTGLLMLAIYITTSLYPEIQKDLYDLDDETIAIQLLDINPVTMLFFQTSIALISLSITSLVIFIEKFSDESVIKYYVFFYLFFIVEALCIELFNIRKVFFKSKNYTYDLLKLAKYDVQNRNKFINALKSFMKKDFNKSMHNKLSKDYCLINKKCLISKDYEFVQLIIKECYIELLVDFNREDNQKYINLLYLLQPVQENLLEIDNQYVTNYFCKIIELNLVLDKRSQNQLVDYYIQTIQQLVTSKAKEWNKSEFIKGILATYKSTNSLYQIVFRSNIFDEFIEQQNYAPAASGLAYGFFLNLAYKSNMKYFKKHGFLCADLLKLMIAVELAEPIGDFIPLNLSINCLPEILTKCIECDDSLFVHFVIFVFYYNKLFPTQSIKIDQFVKILNNYNDSYYNLLNEMIILSTNNVEIIEIEEISGGNFMNKDGHFDLYRTREMDSFLGSNLCNDLNNRDIFRTCGIIY
ncbi:MAG: hypothetical protein K2X04_03355 [Burkholderiales bacterium]|nr:hypothetical protein [Burkholderiales bacterium]